VPALGEHTERVLRELGLSEAEVLALRQGGAI
jgi:crotonobetainyl-CoA:carnitine CoA-transferase CaiB-like acyl-CoA transferase